MSLHVEVRGEVGQICSLTERQLVIVDKRKLLLPPYYNRYTHSATMAWVRHPHVALGKVTCLKFVDS